MYVNNRVLYIHYKTYPKGFSIKDYSYVPYKWLLYDSYIMRYKISGNGVSDDSSNNRDT